MQTNNHTIRESNIIMIINQIKKLQPVSRADLSQSTSLNKVSVSEIVKILIESKLVREIGDGVSTTLGGRKPIMLAFNELAGVVIGIDVRLDDIIIKVSDLDGTILSTQTTPTIKHYETILEVLNAEHLKYSNLPYRIVGCALSIHGIVHDNQIFFTPYYNVLDLELLQNDFNFPITLINEANAAAYAHHYYELDDESTIATITLGTGIGSGIVFNKGIYLGQFGNAGELGHTIVLPKGRPCPCGNTGCLEQYASEVAITNSFAELKKNPNLTFDDFIKYYRLKDPIALDIFEEVVEFLSIGAGNYIALYAPQKLFLVGKLFDSIPELREHIVRNTNSIFTNTTDLNASLYTASDGACLFSIQHFINNTNF